VNGYAPSKYSGLLLVRLREPSAQALLEAVSMVATDIANGAGCFVVLTDSKLRIKRP
jgi:hypothetical protein